MRKQWSRRALPTLATVLAGLVGAWLGLLVAGTTEATVGPLGVDAAITPAWGGETVVEVDPIGTLVIDSHNAPLRVHVAVRTVDIAGVRTIVASPAELAALDDRLVADLRDVLRKAAARAGLVAIAGAVIVGGLLLRSVRRGLIAGASKRSASA